MYKAALCIIKEEAEKLEIILITVFITHKGKWNHILLEHNVAIFPFMVLLPAHLSLIKTN